MKPANPFVDAADALAAHGRQQAGRVVRLLVDDPETREEIEAEQARMRALRYQERRRATAADMRALSAANKRGPDGRFIKG